jgi:hypothetical protein
MSELTLDYGETVIHEWTVGHDKLGHPYIIVFALDGAAAVWRFSHVCTTAGRTHRVGLKIGHDVVATDPLHIVASILCTDCNTHGWVRDGKWVNAS